MSKSHSCPICATQMNDKFCATVLGKYEANYEDCPNCGLLRARNPFWLDEAYTEAINQSDTGLVMRNFVSASKVTNILFFGLDYRANHKFVDIAGGYGLLTRLMRDFGFDFYWADKFCQNLVALGFEYKPEIGACDALTAMEVMEHIADPIGFVRESFVDYGANTLIFTTELYGGCPPKPQDWWYYSFETGQHISFYQKRTLQYIANELGLHFISAHGIHIFSKKKINSILIYLITTKIATIILPWVVRFLNGSKTISDHRQILSGS